MEVVISKKNKFIYVSFPIKKIEQSIINIALSLKKNMA